MHILSFVTKPPSFEILHYVYTLYIYSKTQDEDKNMVWPLACNFDARHCHGGSVIKSNKTINIFNTRRCDSSYGSCGFGFGFGGGGFWNALAGGLGFGLGTRLFSGISSWINGGSFWAGMGFGNQGGYAGGGYAGGAGMYPWAGQTGGYYPGATTRTGCNCGCNGGSGLYGTGTSFIPGPYSTLDKITQIANGDKKDVITPPPNAEDPTDPVPPPAKEEVAKSVDDIINGKKLPENADDLKKILTPENIDKIIKDISKMEPDAKKALLGKLQELFKNNKNGTNYKFTNNYKDLKCLQLLCKLDPNAVVDVAKNNNTGGAVTQAYIHGSITNVQKDDNGKITILAVDNSNVSNEYGLKYTFEATDSTNKSFKVTSIKDKNNEEIPENDSHSQYKNNNSNDRVYIINDTTGLMEINEKTPLIQQK